MSELGYFGIRYPEEYGGVGGDEVMFTLLREKYWSPAGVRLSRWVM